MALDFPASPTTNQTYSGPGGVVWVWDGSKWVSGTGSTVYAPVTSPVFLGNPTAPNPPAGDADTSVATTSFVAAAVAPAFNDRGRNLLHNPLFNVAQRGVGPFNGTARTLDRWAITAASDATSVSQVAASDATRTQIGDEAAQFLWQNIFTGNAGATAFSLVQQPIEQVRRLANKIVTVSFWAQASVGTLKIGVSIDQSFGTGGSPSAYVPGNGNAITLSTNWARYTTTITVPSVVGKTLGTNADDYTSLLLWFSSGANQAVRTGNIGVQSGTIVLWGVQLEIGSVATPLEKPDPRYDLANCQRFYCTGNALLAVYMGATGALGYFVGWPVTMRAAPTVVITNSASSVNISTPSVNIQSTTGANFYGFATTVLATQLWYNWTASADL